MFNTIAKANNSKIIIAIIVMFDAFYVKSVGEKTPGLIYILTWTDASKEPFVRWKEAQESLISNNCTFQNCYIVKNRNYYQDILDYDVLLFNPSGISDEFPMARSDNQLYVLTCTEPAAYLALGDRYNWFFNYTWTYRLDSDVTFPYFYIRNKRDELVGPKINARWRNMSRMRPTQKDVIDKLQNKSIAAAWFVSNCHDINKRLSYGYAINEALSKYNLSIDIYGSCGNKYCPKDHFAECMGLVEKSYYFYLAFENSNSEDYVTEKLMTALCHFAVPVVLGGANYSRFIPDGFYLNGNILSEVQVAAKINEAVQNKQMYYDYFRWHRYYTYQSVDGGLTDPLCAFCAFLNDNSIRTQRRVYARIDKWWNDYRGQNVMEDFIVNYEESAAYIKSFVSYREKDIAIQPIATTSMLENVNNFFVDLFSYYFP